MLKLKSCPRCGGDMRIDRDHYGWYEECIQCGYLCDLPSVANAQEQNPEKGKAHNGVKQKGCYPSNAVPPVNGET